MSPAVYSPTAGPGVSRLTSRVHCTLCTGHGHRSAGSVNLSQEAPGISPHSRAGGREWGTKHCTGLHCTVLKCTALHCTALSMGCRRQNTHIPLLRRLSPICRAGTQDCPPAPVPAPASAPASALPCPAPASALPQLQLQPLPELLPLPSPSSSPCPAPAPAPARLSSICAPVTIS
jgi:hypothetical protein